ncbi:MAG: phosphatidate cytidylyltransferase [Pseudomonadales bacterium]|nr:phosphatidate cytidylyltransferase [Pseudomonadales bacterium]
MLRQRIITGIVIAPIALAGVFLLPPLEFAFFVGAVLAVAAWEWANFAGLSSMQRYVYAALIAASMAGVYYLPTIPVLAVSLLWWTIAFVLVVGYPKFDELWGHTAVIVIIGFVVMLPGFAALNALKQFPQSSYLICLLFFLIWGADIGAYFSGKAFGKAKLAPMVSPGKSWAGFFGGVVTSGVIATLMALYSGSPVMMSWTGLAYLAACMGIAVVSVLGDLTISMFKRHRDIKDSSNLLPGHGGFLDRIDSLLSASPVFALYLLFASWL